MQDTHIHSFWYSLFQKDCGNFVVQTNTWVTDWAVSLIPSALPWTVRAKPWASLTLQHMSTIRSPFRSWRIMSNFSLVLTVFCWFLTCITLGDVDLYFSSIFVQTTNAEEGGVKQAACLYHQCNQSIHVTDAMTVTLFSASLQHKMSAATFHPCQIMLNWTLPHEFEKLCKFSSNIKAKSCKNRPVSIHLHLQNTLYQHVLLVILPSHSYSANFYLEFHSLFCTFWTPQQHMASSLLKNSRD